MDSNLSREVLIAGNPSKNNSRIINIHPALCHDSLYCGLSTGHMTGMHACAHTHMLRSMASLKSMTVAGIQWCLPCQQLTSCLVVIGSSGSWAWDNLEYGGCMWWYCCFLFDLRTAATKGWTISSGIAAILHSGKIRSRNILLQMLKCLRF